MPDHYQTLGVSRTATPDEITKAYKKLARQHHPDRNVGDKSAEAKFKEVQGAYDTLNDPKKKSMYDQYGTDQPMPEGGFNFGGGGGGHGMDPDMAEKVFGRFFGDSGMPNMGSFFGGASAKKNRRRAPEPENLEAEARIPLLTAAMGGTVSLRVGNKNIDLKIPAGIEEGKKLRIAGQAPGGGDITVRILLEEHPYFRREGKDIFLDVPISIVEAVRGGKLEVPLISGKRATVKVMPGTTGNSRLRLPGQGLAGGDQYLVFKIVVPKNPQPETLELIDRLAELHPENPRADQPWAV
jgi:curved DNA-binding protein